LPGDLPVALPVGVPKEFTKPLNVKPSVGTGLTSGGGTWLAVALMLAGGVQDGWPCGNLENGVTAGVAASLPK